MHAIWTIRKYPILESFSTLNFSNKTKVSVFILGVGKKYTQTEIPVSKM